MLALDHPSPAALPHIIFGGCHKIGRRILLLGSRRSRRPPAPVLPSGPLFELSEVLREPQRGYEAAARVCGCNYQDGYWLLFLTAPLAVVCAAVGTTWGGENVLSGVELVLMLATIALFVTIRKRGWREKWVRARRTAEYLRYLPLIAPYITDWSRNWYEQMAARHGSPAMPDEDIGRICQWLNQIHTSRNFSLNHCASSPHYRAYVLNLLNQQAQYHQTRAHEEHTLNRRIGAISTTLFAATVVATLLIFLEPFGLQASFAGWLPAAEVLRFLATVLPAIGAALRGLLAQSESHRLAALSDALSIRLQGLMAELEPAQALEGIAEAAQETRMELVVWATVQELLSEADTWMRLQASVPLSMGT